jgi:hypothetical protein
MKLTTLHTTRQLQHLPLQPGKSEANVCNFNHDSVII